MNLEFDNKKFNPIIDRQEARLLEEYSEKYNKIITPSKLQKNLKVVGNGIKAIVPKPIVGKIDNVIGNITSTEMYDEVMKVVANGFSSIEEVASKYTINEQGIIKQLNKVDNSISSINEICIMRSYDIKKAISINRVESLSLAAIQGGVTGLLGFAGVPFNIASSFFVFFRAVQSIAMYYGYDVKNDDSELKIASQVLINSLSPTNLVGGDGMQQLVGKVMVISQMSILKDGLKKKTYEQMAKSGGVELLFVQLRALANVAAKKALNKAGKKGLEKTIFTETLEQIFKNVSKKVAGKAIPVFSAAFSALIDAGTMNKILEYSEIFYHKRFLAEKQSRIYELLESKGIAEVAVDVEFTEE